MEAIRSARTGKTQPPSSPNPSSPIESRSQQLEWSRGISTTAAAQQPQKYQTQKYPP
ncbi:MAG: hypothetical protein MUE44_20515 [Oscillatoriaceae cyanobacterium Prado104]|nr:hypothetical protein [Oscillatoriaceae cyanobacterium Prado104]